MTVTETPIRTTDLRNNETYQARAGAAAAHRGHGSVEFTGRTNGILSARCTCGDNIFGVADFDLVSIR